MIIFTPGEKEVVIAALRQQKIALFRDGLYAEDWDAYSMLIDYLDNTIKKVEND